MRTYTKWSSKAAEQLLGVLIDLKTSHEIYGEAMTGLGRQLADQIVSQVPAGTPVCVVCTVEDADFLARGLLERLREDGVESDRLKLVCFWNERVREFSGINTPSFDIAPIIKQYREEIDLHNSIVVIVKSIISGACVVKTNLAALIEDVVPYRIFVAAPVMLKGAEERLSAEFPSDTAKRFEYFTFAIDDQKGVDENVVPGIGGSVYDRLGFSQRIGYVPELVKQRRDGVGARPDPR